MRNRLWTAAGRAPVPVFVVAGSAAPSDLAFLRLNTAIDVVDSPRQADVLLVAGEFNASGIAALHRVHDQLSTPRFTIRWGDKPVDGLAGVTTDGGTVDDVAGFVIREHIAVLGSAGRGEPPILPDVDPAEWRGVGPYGQGGKGMTGGVPYGRPMAERGLDRDELQLDALPVTIGPWLPSLPSGLVMRVVFQGDLIREVSLGEASVPASRGGVFWDALSKPVPIADLELARARHHLTWLAEALRLFDLSALGRRALRLAATVTPEDEQAVNDLKRVIRRTGLFRWSLPTTGTITADSADGLGPIARSCGKADDARRDDPGYRALGFEPITHDGRDVAARWRQRLAEISQSLRLAADGAEISAFGGGIVEGPRGRLEVGQPTPSALVVERLPDMLVGLEWGDAVAVVASLDIDMGEASISTETMKVVGS